MPEVTVKDINQQELIRVLAAFLKKSRKLKVPKWVDTVKLAKHKELAPYDENWFYMRAASTAWHLYLHGGTGVGSITKIYGGQKRNDVRPTSAEALRVWPPGPPSPGGAENGGEGPRWGHKLTPRGQRDLDRTPGQLAAANKKH